MTTGESFTYAALCEREQDGTITPEGAAWLIGYNRGMDAENYAEAYGEGDDFALMPPGSLPDDMLGWFASGALKAAEDKENGK